MFYPERFDFFYQIIKEHFIKNAELIIKYLEEKNTNNPNDIYLSTSMYNMNVVLNYNKLLKQFKETLENIKK